MVFQTLNAFSRSEICHHDFFTAVQSLIQHGHAFSVVTVGWLNLDHSGAHLLQNQRRSGAGQIAGKVNYGNAFEQCGILNWGHGIFSG